ncbi:MAG TPA: nucleoside hydrolase [Bacteroidales bacterium]|nr:nucleoside hydrolase [Bacteroidales bacterium]
MLNTGCRNNTAGNLYVPVRIIFDTDLGSDYDDVGALAFLHAMADSGKAVILATMASNKYELTVPSIDVINTYFNKPEIPIGSPKSAGVDDRTFYSWTDSIVAQYPHIIKSNSDAPDAVEIYRKILSEQPDGAVTVITVGFLTNLYNLLRSQPDNISELPGTDLVRKKVRNLVTMGGVFPDRGRSFNIFMDSVASEFVLRNWPGEIIFTGNHIGEAIKTGLRLVNSDINNSPVKDAYRISMRLSEWDKDGRMSWDQTAVLIGIYGTEGFFDTVRGKITVYQDGSNSWENNKSGSHLYVNQKMPVEDMARFIEKRMMHLPEHR